MIVETANKIKLNGLKEVICTHCGKWQDMNDGVLLIPEGVILDIEEPIESLVERFMEELKKEND